MHSILLVNTPSPSPTVVRVVMESQGGFSLKDLAVPFGVIIAAVLAFIAQQKTSNKSNATQLKAIDAQLSIARENLGNQRALARDQRIWEKQAETYLEVITTLTTVSLSLPESPDYTDSQITGWRGLNRQMVDLTPQVSAFASQRVADSFSHLGHNFENWINKGAVLAALSKPGNNVIPGSTQPERASARLVLVDELTAGKDALKEQLDRVVRTCRADLQSVDDS